VRAGGVVGVPTDTVYGLAVDPLDDDAVLRLFDLKGRPDHKPVGVLVASIDQAETGGEIEGAARVLAEHHWPGALTLIVTPKVILADWVGDRQRKTVGLRVPNHPVTLALLTAAGPLAVTSANRSGGAETMTDVEAREVFGDEVDFYLEGVSPGGRASTVVDATGARLTVLRQGPVTI
jgi:tRNA threonylcarbamoyl adenosine modification protein (Sua5/YciO/YrdC/YwlC family)